MNLMNEIPASDRAVTSQDNALITTDFLAANYGGLIKRLDAFEGLLKVLPPQIYDDEQSGEWQDTIKALDDHIKAIESTREAVKAPFLAANGIVDSFFKSLATKDPKKPGRGDLIRMKMATVVGTYLQRKASIERQRREEEARQLREAEENRRREAAEREEAARKAEEANRHAEAERTQFQADLATAEAQRIGDQASEMEQSANAKSADLARTRSQGGSLATLTDKWEFEIIDITAVRGAPLWAFIKREHKEMAIRAYRDANAPKNLPSGEEWQPLEGVRFYRTQKLQVRR